ncbi:hypothetical protein V6N13_009384 [Hibiscus sabdariffa]|uniref:Uncharacterized protein n=2 Tax=Hibiscus sabdariffa TaxID=183260 RepID=A0ABR2PPA2_9ROSI
MVQPGKADPKIPPSMVQPGEADPKIPPPKVQPGEPDRKTLPAMVQAGGADNKGRPSAVPADDPNAEFNFPIEKLFLLRPALYGQQNAQRLMMQEPVRISSIVLANMLQNPAPLKNRPSLMPPPPAAPTPPRSADPRRVRINVSTNHPCAGGENPRVHPNPRKQKEPVKASVGEEEEVNSYDIRPRKVPRYHHPYEMGYYYNKGYNSIPGALPTDLLDEWMPIYRCGYHGQRGSSSGRALPIPAPIRRNNPVEQREAAAAAAPAHSGGSSSDSCEALDLNLKLGF